jgi:acyl carrier protein
MSSLGEDKCTNISLESNISGGEMDSVTFIKIVVALEAEFDFEFDDEMLLITKFPTIKTMIDYVESKAVTNCENV